MPPVQLIDVAAGELPRDRWAPDGAGPGTEPEPLSASVADFLTQRFGRPPHPAPITSTRSQEGTGPTRLTPDDLEAFARAFGSSVDAQAVVSTEPLVRSARATGMSYLDLLARRTGSMPTAPDAVALPRNHHDVMRVLQVCSERSVAVVPFGGGTSVVGGVTADLGGRPFVSLDTSRMNRLLSVNAVDMTATVGPGITGGELERLLGARGLRWGHVPQSWERASVGGYLATRSSGQASAGYGRSTATAIGLRVATPAGEVVLGRAPDSAAGPDLRQLFLGSEGTLGVITEATLSLRPAPEVRRYEALLLPDFQTGLDAVRHIVQARISPDVLRLSDPDETQASLQMSGPSGTARAVFDRYLELRGVDTGCLLILGWEDSRAQVRRRREAVRDALKGTGATSLGQRVGRSWEHGRFSGPRLRDTLMGYGYLVETLETATSWSDLPRLREVIAEALRASLTQHAAPFVMSHVSHTYPAGASLYVTVLAPATSEDPAGQWREAKSHVTDALMAHGATLTHHHAVGRDHAPWYSQEVGPLGVRALAAVKEAVDPEWILNPGVLIERP